MLARLLSADMLAEVWIPDERTRALRRRIARRAALVRQRTRAKNEVHAVVMRCLLGRPPVTDLFGRAGRAWLGCQELPAEESETVSGDIAEHALDSPQIRRLMTIPGVDVATAAALIAAIGDVRRFGSSRQLVAYLGLDPKLRQSGDEPARGGRISKRGNAQARSVLVEAAWVAIRSPGPLRAFGERIRARRGAQVAAVAVARKLAVLCWQMLTKQEGQRRGSETATLTTPPRRGFLAATSPSHIHGLASQKTASHPMPKRTATPRLFHADGAPEAPNRCWAEWITAFVAKPTLPNHRPAWKSSRK